MKASDKQMMKFRAKEELKIRLLEVILNYKSKEETKYKLTNTDAINVLSSMIARTTE
jgi:hypothetical protein